MEWAFRFDATRARAVFWRLACVALLLGVVGSAVGERPKNEPSPRDRRGLSQATVANNFLFQVNRVILQLQDVGEIGSSGSSVAGGGFWKANTNQYIFSSGANVGAKLPDGTIVFANGGPFSELNAGSERFPELEVYWDSADENDRANFPEVCTVDAPRVERFPSLASFAGEPFPGFADRTVCIAVNDYTGGTCGECAGTRVGVTIVETIFAFGVPTVQDFVFVMIRMYNDSRFINASNSPAQQAGPYTLSETVFSFAMDPDIGDAGDDQAAFLPDIQTAAFWDVDFTESGFQGPLGVGGTGLVVLPVDPVTGNEIPLAEFSLFTNGAPRPDPNQKEIWYAIQRGDPTQVILEVDPRDVRWMVSTVPFELPPDAFVEMGAAYFFSELSGPPPANLRAQAYKNLVTGELIPGANADPAFDNLRLQALVAAASANAGFLQPVAPPSPGFDLIPGDHQITIAWDGSPITTANPFARLVRAPFDPEEPVATGIILGPTDVVFFGGTFQTAAEAGIAGQEVTNVAFNPGFVVFDFEGFRVYRSRTGLADDAELITQVDLANTIGEGEFCIAATPVLDAEGNFLTNVCIETGVQFSPGGAGGNTGLGFAIIDRGGQFPDPSQGSGLINGIPVAYAVTSFGVNCGILVPVIPPGTGTSPPAACLELESGKVFKLATPESNPSSFVGAVVGDVELLDGDGNPVTGNDVDIPVNADGDLTGPIPPARDFDFNVAVIQPLEIPAAFEVVLHIEDFSMSQGFDAFFCAGFPTAADCFWEDPGIMADLPAGAGVGATLRVTVTDGDGNVLQTPTGPAQDIATASGPQNFGANTPTSTPVIQILSPEDPSKGVAFTIQYTAEVGPRNANCILGGTCASQNPLPASVSSWRFARQNYGQAIAATIELTWSNQNGVLSLSSVRDVSNNVDMQFQDFFGQVGWGFATASTLRAVEDEIADAVGTPRTDDGKVLYPEPHCAAVEGASIKGAGACDNHGILGLGFMQGGPIWEDLPVDPDIFAKLAPTANSYTPNYEFWQQDAQQPTAALFNLGGKKGTRLSIAGHYLTMVFNNLPADGEQWTLHFPRGTGGNVAAATVRSPVPGMAVRVSIAGGTSELAAADLNAIKVVPNPFIAVNEITRGRGLQRILFTQLPPQATIRIYTISGNLVRVLEHSDGTGTEEFDVRTRFDLLLASGNYYYHVTTPDGRTHLGRFAVIN